MAEALPPGLRRRLAHGRDLPLYVEADADDNVLELFAEVPPGVQISAGVDGLDSEIGSGNVALLLLE